MCGPSFRVHRHDSRFIAEVRRATPIEVTNGVIDGHDETQAPPTRKGRLRARRPRSEAQASDAVHRYGA
jgi:hypothetical protein